MKHTPTVAELRRTIEERKALTAPIWEAFKRGNIEECKAAQKTLRDVYPEMER